MQSIYEKGPQLRQFLLKKVIFDHEQTKIKSDYVVRVVKLYGEGYVQYQATRCD